MRFLDYFRTPLIERIEITVKQVADCRADVEFHRFMADYFLEERQAIDSHASAALASEYARLYRKQEEHEEDHTLAQRKYRDARAKLEALQGKKPT